MSHVNKEKENLITHKYVKQLFHYDSEKGILYWKSSRKKRRQKDSTAGIVSLNKFGTTGNGKPLIRPEPQKRMVVSIQGRSYMMHRIIYFWYHGVWPEYVDHIDGNPLNNKIENLRSVSAAENALNKKLPVSNKSGIMGVNFNEKTKKWVASGTCNKKLTHIGTFDDKDDAIAARRQWEKDNGFHENYGKRI